MRHNGSFATAKCFAFDTERHDAENCAVFADSARLPRLFGGMRQNRPSLERRTALIQVGEKTSNY
ncbi:hypothetical protein B5K08_19815 [Rhizobium leguminosarum bv. trifolii]|uniref:Uncharacterized protein n=1 Tax=Rhizobium leguminosarum bv. trifolii TaxID=386 RepID=A0A3E1BEU1_RHILT|nr:hypothetical protein B5K08_19815 [Rhizobium leguminosarum bv. trifolii]RFB90562.1 hypothetical protein B5K10_19805 [Rhizobium leguminosarum bv. trifolii]